jgi:FkbM family methyltransferase
MAPTIRDRLSTTLRRFAPLRIAYRAAFGAEGRNRRKNLANFYSRFLKMGDLAFDIGANIGVYSEVLQSIGARVIAVEPNPECAEQIRWTTSRDFVIVVQAGVGDRVGTGKLFVNKTNVLSSMSVDQVESTTVSPWKNEIEVQVVTIDSLVEQFGVPRFIKLDVEGFEVAALSGMSRQPEFLSFEYHWDNFAKVEACLQKLSPDSQFDYVIDEPFKLEINRWVDRDQLWQHIQSARNSTFGGDIIAYLPPPQLNAIIDQPPQSAGCQP